MSAPELVALARARALSLVSAESCTGGLVGAAITEVPGASDVYLGGFITYSNAMKRTLLGVEPDSLARFGAVSEPVAQQMARGARRASGADLAISVTGIAGPGGSEHKPEGRVCFGLASAQGVASETVEFGARGREAVRAAACAHALEMLLAAMRAG